MSTIYVNRFPDGSCLSNQELRELQTLAATDPDAWYAKLTFYCERGNPDVPKRAKEQHRPAPAPVRVTDDHMRALLEKQSEILAELKKPVIPQYDPKTGRLIAAKRK